MKVLHVNASLGQASGGMLSTLRGLTHAWHAAGVACTVVAIGEPHANTTQFESAQLHLFPPGRPKRLAASSALKAWLLENAAHFDAVLAQGIWLSPTRYAFDAAQKARRPFLLLPAGMLDPDALAHHRFRKALRWWLGERGMVRSSNILFSTEEDRARAMNHLALDPLRCHILGNPVREVFFDMPLRPMVECPHIICLNRLHPRKGVREFVQALLLLDEAGVSFRVTIAGPDEDKAYSAACRDLGKRLSQAGQLHWAGLLDSAGVLKLVSESDVVVHPAVGFENFGMVIAEALAAGRAVVASRRALLTPQLERAGLVEAVNPEPAQISQALSRLLAMRDAWPRRAQAGRDYAREHFGISAVGRQLVALLEQVRATCA